MSAFDPAQHPRGHHSNPGRFSEKIHTEPEASLHTPAVMSPLDAAINAAKAVEDAARHVRLTAVTRKLQDAITGTFPGGEKAVFLRHWNRDSDDLFPLEAVLGKDGEVLFDRDRGDELEGEALTRIHGALAEYGPHTHEQLYGIDDDDDGEYTSHGTALQLDLTEPVDVPPLRITTDGEPAKDPAAGVPLESFDPDQFDSLRRALANRTAANASWIDRDEIAYRLEEGAEHCGLPEDAMPRLIERYGSRQAALEQITDTAAWYNLDDTITEKVTRDVTYAIADALTELEPAAE